MPTDSVHLALLLEPYHGTDRLVIPRQAGGVPESAPEIVHQLPAAATCPLLWDGDQA